MVRALFVCTGNICRSPTAEAVFRNQVAQAGLADAIEIDSAGTHGFHVGEPPDARATAAASERGIELDAIRSRRFAPYDLERFEYILAMDDDNLGMLLGHASGEGERRRIHRMLDFASTTNEREVPDPYYGPSGGFERVLDLIEEASDGLLRHIRQHHEL